MVNILSVSRKRSRKPCGKGGQGIPEGEMASEGSGDKLGQFKNSKQNSDAQPGQRGAVSGQGPRRGRTETRQGLWVWLLLQVTGEDLEPLKQRSITGLMH